MAATVTASHGSTTNRLPSPVIKIAAFFMAALALLRNPGVITRTAALKGVGDHDGARQELEAFAASEFTGDTRLARAAQTQTVIQGVIIVTIAFVGIIVVDQLDITFAAPTNTGLSESQQGLLSGFGSMIDLVEPLLVVLMAVVLIAVVQRIRQ